MRTVTSTRSESPGGQGAEPHPQEGRHAPPPRPSQEPLCPVRGEPTCHALLRQMGVTGKTWGSERDHPQGARRAGHCPVPRAPHLLSASLTTCRVPSLCAGKLSPVPSLGHTRPPQPLLDHTDARNCPTETERKPVSQVWSPRKDALMSPALPAALTLP